MAKFLGPEEGMPCRVAGESCRSNGLPAVVDRVGNCSDSWNAGIHSPASGPRLARKHTLNAKSYEDYLQALFFLNKRTYNDENKSVELFEKSAQKDPGLRLRTPGWQMHTLRCRFFAGVFLAEGVFCSNKSSGTGQ